MKRRHDQVGLNKWNLDQKGSEQDEGFFADF